MYSAKKGWEISGPESGTSDDRGVWRKQWNSHTTVLSLHQLSVVLFGQRINNHAFDVLKHSVRILVSVDVLCLQVIIVQLFLECVVWGQSPSHALLTILGVAAQSFLHFLRAGRVVEHVIPLPRQLVCGPEGQALNHRVIGHVQEKHSEKNKQNKGSYSTTRS